MKFFPEPNANINGNNYFVTPPSTNNDWQYMGRMDQNFSDNDRLLPFWPVQSE